MAIYVNQVAVSKIRAWVHAQIDLVPVPPGAVESSPGSGLYALTGSETESTPGSGLYLIDPEYATGENTERHIIRVLYWDEDGVEHIVWDGTQSQNIAVPTATATGLAPAAVASSSPDAISAPTATATGQANVPGVSASKTAEAPTATGTGATDAPGVSASKTVEAPTATGQANANVNVHSPNIQAPTATATGESDVTTLQIEGSNYLSGTTASATAQGEVPGVSASKTVTPPTATAQGSGPAPVFNKSRTVTGATGTASAQAEVPMATTAGFPMGMTKSGTQSIPQSTWTKVTGFIVRDGFPDTVLSDSRLVMNGTMTNATITFRGSFTGGVGTRQFRAYVNGVPVGSAVNETVVGNVTGQNLNPNDYVELWAYNSYSTGRTVEATNESTTYIYITA